MNFEKSDRDLLAGCLQGVDADSDAFVRRFSDIIYRSVQYVLRRNQVQYSKFDLEDLHSTVFLKLFEKKCGKLRQFKGKNGCSVATWLQTVTVRMVLDQLRAKSLGSIGSRNRLFSLEDMAELQSGATDAWIMLERDEKQRAVQQGIEKLSSRDQLLIRMTIEKGLAIQEVADTLNISVQGVYTAKHRAVQRLKEQLSVDSDQ